MDEKKIARINELAKKAKIQSLTAGEKCEQKALRKEYLASIKANLRSTLENMLVENEAGEYEPLPKKTAAKKNPASPKHSANCSCGCGGSHNHGEHEH